MPEYEHDRRHLPGARLAAGEFREIQAVLGEEYRAPNGGVTWEFYRGKRNNSGEDLDQLLAEIEDKKGISGFRVLAEDDGTSIELYGDSAGCSIEYDASEGAIGKTLDKVRRIEGIFRDNIRTVARIPGFRRPKLDVGQPTIVIKVSRDEIIQAVLTKWMTTLLTAPVSYGLGVLTGWLAL